MSVFIGSPVAASLRLRGESCATMKSGRTGEEIDAVDQWAAVLQSPTEVATAGANAPA